MTKEHHTTSSNLKSILIKTKSNPNGITLYSHNDFNLRFETQEDCSWIMIFQDFINTTNSNLTAIFAKEDVLNIMFNY